MKQLLPPVPYGTPVTGAGGKLSVPWTGFFKQLSGGLLNIRGTDSNDLASAGYVGEYISANSAGPAVASTGALANIASIPLTPGDWDVDGVAAVNLSGFTLTALVGAISTSSAATDSTNQGGISKLVPGASSNYVSTGLRRISLAANATVYLVGSVSYSGGSGSWSADSIIRARRVR